MDKQNRTFELMAPARTALISRTVDFWLLGGGSIVILALLIFTSGYPSSGPVSQRLMQLPVAVALLSLIANHPHFMISYRFAYARGARFIFKNWFALVAVPVAMLLAVLVAFLNFNVETDGVSFIQTANDFLGDRDIAYRFAFEPYLGSEILGIGILVMNFTVGWHYSKQVFGALLVYARFDKFILSRLSKTSLKANLLALAALQFVWLVRLTEKVMPNGVTDQRFPGVSVSPLGFSENLERVALGLTLFSFALAAVAIWKDIRKQKKWPSVNFMVIWISFYLWWFPAFVFPYFIMLIPFFHSLQYLAFAHRMSSSLGEHKGPQPVLNTLKVFALIAIGFLAFELLPNALDLSLETSAHQTTWFFVTAFALFINIHHFFIDSVIWRSNHPFVRKAFS